MNEEEKKEEGVYSIPGVIIPEQTTDSGVVLKSDNTNNKVEDKQTNEENTDEKSVYQMPGVIIPEQTTDGGKVEQINNVNSDNLYTPVEKEVVDTSVTPILPGMMPEAPKEEVVNGKKKKVKKEGNAKIGILELIIILLLGVVLYFVYTTYINPPKVSSDDYKLLNKKVFNKKGYIVLELYDWVSVKGCNSLNSILYNGNDIVKVSELKDEDKLFLAYLQLKNRDFASKNCANYSTSLHSNDKTNTWYCGNNTLTDDTKETTLILSAAALKKQVIKMFGQGEYKAKTFQIHDGSRYLYDKKSDIYILQTSDIVSNCDNITTKLSGVSNYDNYIILTVEVKINNREETRYVRFIKSNDGNYYFDQISKS